MHRTRRKVLIGAATLATVGVGSSLVAGEDPDSPWDVTEVNEEVEYVIFTNTSGSEVDVSGAIVALEYGNKDYDQRRPIPDATSVEGGGQLVVYTGAKKDHSSGTAGVTDVSLGYDGEVLNNDGNDVVALLSPDESEVWCRSDEKTDGSSGNSDDSDDSESGGSDSDDSGRIRMTRIRMTRVRTVLGWTTPLRMIHRMTRIATIRRITPILRIPVRTSHRRIRVPTISRTTADSTTPVLSRNHYPQWSLGRRRSRLHTRFSVLLSVEQKTRATDSTATFIKTTRK